MLLVAMSLNGCSDSAGYDDNTEETVAVDLLFSVSSTAQQPSSRLTPSVIQDNTAFRGLQNLHVIPFGVKGKIAATDNPKAFQVNGVSEANYDRRENHNSWFYYYDNCIFASGTSSFLAYGRAVPMPDPDNEESEIALKAYSGSIVTGVDPTWKPSETTFRLESIRPDNSIPAQGQYLADFLTNIANTVGEGSGYSSERVWATTSEASLKALYLSFTNQTNEGADVLAGSSSNVAAHVKALKQQLSTLTVSTPDHQALLDALRANVSDDLDAALLGYPASVGLPDGAAVLRWDGAKFIVETQTTTLAKVNNISRYAYPAELCYYANSQIYTSNSEVGSEKYAAATNWSSVLSNYEYKAGATISGNTRSVALIEPLQYAVACLNLNVKNTSATLNDANGTAVSVAVQNFPMTAIIVGGQVPLQYDFTPQTPYSELETRFVYDHHVKDNTGNTIFLTTGSGVTESASTLVLQSFDGESVPIVLELTNNSDKDFMGLNGVIYRGTKFYLVGKINPDDATSGQTESTEGRVFTQDYTTSVTVKIESLEKAYNVLPDLLTPRLEVGVEIASKWIQSTPSDVLLE